MMKTSPRPKARTPKAEIQGYLSGVEKEKGKVIDARRSSPKPMPRPKAKPYDLEAGAALQRAIRNSQPDKMAKGGKCRGMGAAKKGGSYSKAG